MNRETKRMLQKQGAVDADGNAVRAPRTQAAPKTAAERTPPKQYLSEVKGELKKVVWPTRDEVKNYTFVVLAMLAIMTILTFGLDFVFAKGVLSILDRE